MRVALAIGGLGLVAGVPLSATPDPVRYMRAELIAETLHPTPGSTFLLAFRMSPTPGWHGYWSNPGASGIAPSVDWTGKNLSFGPLLHPAPTLIEGNGISSFVHEGEHMLFSRVTVARGIAEGTALPVIADLNWAACTATQCVPLHAQFGLQLTVGDGTPSAEGRAIRTEFAGLPRAAPDGTFVPAGKRLRLQMPPSLNLDSRRARFFPDVSSTFDTAAARSSEVGGRTVISSISGEDIPRSLSGVVTDGASSFRVTLRRSDEAASEPGAPPTQAVAQVLAEPEGVATIPPQERPPAASEKKSAPRSSWAWAFLGAMTAIGAAASLAAWRRS